MVCLAYEIKRGRRKTMKGILTNTSILKSPSEKVSSQVILGYHVIRIYLRTGLSGSEKNWQFGVWNRSVVSTGKRAAVWILQRRTEICWKPLRATLNQFLFDSFDYSYKAWNMYVLFLLIFKSNRKQGIHAQCWLWETSCLLLHGWWWPWRMWWRRMDNGLENWRLKGTLKKRLRLPILTYSKMLSKGLDLETFYVCANKI